MCARRRGFSLLELLAVVVLLGIIAAIVVPRIASPTDQARSSTADHMTSSINSAIEQYRVEHGTWPTTLDDLVPDYLPDGVPDCPLPGKTFQIDSTTHRVVAN